MMQTMIRKRITAIAIVAISICSLAGAQESTKSEKWRFNVNGWFRSALEFGRNGSPQGQAAAIEAEGSRINAGLQLRISRDVSPRLTFSCETLFFIEDLEGTAVDAVREEFVQVASCEIRRNMSSGALFVEIGRGRRYFGLLNTSYLSGIDLGAFDPPQMYIAFNGFYVDGMAIGFIGDKLELYLQAGAREDLIADPVSGELGIVDSEDLLSFQAFYMPSTSWKLGIGGESFSQPRLESVVPLMGREGDYKAAQLAVEYSPVVGLLDRFVVRSEVQRSRATLDYAPIFGGSFVISRLIGYLQILMEKGAWAWTVRFDTNRGWIEERSDSLLIDEGDITQKRELIISVSRNVNLSPKFTLAFSGEWHEVSEEAVVIRPLPSGIGFGPGPLPSSEFGLLTVTLRF